MDSPDEEFYRPRTPLRFGSVPTALPVDPREYNVRGREDSVSVASASSLNDIFPAILSQESYLDGFDDESGSDFSPSIPPHQSYFSGHEGRVSPHTRSIGTPSIASLQDERLCQCDDRRFPSTSFKTEGELDHTCDHAYSSSSSSLANTPTDEEFIPFYFLPALCIEDEPAPAKSRVSPSVLTTPSWRTRRNQQQDQQQSTQVPAISLSVKKRKLTPPPSATIHTLMSPPPTRLSNPPHRRVPKTERTRPPTALLQRQLLHHPTPQCSCVQCQRRAPPTYLPPTQYATTAPHQPSPPQPAAPPTTNFQAPLWQTPATLTAAAAAGTGLQGLPTTQYEWQQKLPHMQQQPPASPKVGQQGVDVWGFLPSSNATYGVY